MLVPTKILMLAISMNKRVKNVLGWHACLKSPLNFARIVPRQLKSNEFREYFKFICSNNVHSVCTINTLIYTHYSCPIEYV
ncbi:hypothetical protein EUGRSUZ_E02465 [Eucalyptus grandis]|uniref:Uncharacterized protein n=2 Tax=Eucalyptus grandis TaxID=71139 RepID=A0ACC3KX92_EUCGR|nr:hypothetical protein EUGRSUZ_E02465 [Eucalyptus grandis]